MKVLVEVVLRSDFIKCALKMIFRKFIYNFMISNSSKSKMFPRNDWNHPAELRDMKRIMLVIIISRKLLEWFRSVASTWHQVDINWIWGRNVDKRVLSCKQHLLKYVETNNILMEAQSGFRKAHSTALNLVLQSWRDEIDNGNDLKRAFETIDRVIMLNKLKAMGVDGIELRWFQDYLAEDGYIQRLHI